MMVFISCTRSQNGWSAGSSRYCPLVWPLIMAPTKPRSRMRRDRARQKIVGLGRAARRHCGIALDLHARPREPQHRGLDAGAIHGGKPHLTEIEQLSSNASI